MEKKDIKLHSVVAHKEHPYEPLWVVNTDPEHGFFTVIPVSGLACKYTIVNLIPYTPKPEPRVIWVTFDSDGDVVSTFDDENLLYGLKAVKMVEEMEEK